MHPPEKVITYFRLSPCHRKILLILISLPWQDLNLQPTTVRMIEKQHARLLGSKGQFKENLIRVESFQDNYIFYGLATFTG